MTTIDNNLPLCLEKTAFFYSLDHLSWVDYLYLDLGVDQWKSWTCVSILVHYGVEEGGIRGILTPVGRGQIMIHHTREKLQTNISRSLRGTITNVFEYIYIYIYVCVCFPNWFRFGSLGFKPWTRGCIQVLGSLEQHLQQILWAPELP